MYKIGDIVEIQIGKKLKITDLVVQVNADGSTVTTYIYQIVV